MLFDGTPTPNAQVVFHFIDPATKRTGSRLPAHVEVIEARLAALWSEEPHELRRSVWRNLRGLATASQTLTRFPRPVTQTLIAA